MPVIAAKHVELWAKANDLTRPSKDDRPAESYGSFRVHPPKRRGRPSARVTEDVETEPDAPAMKVANH